MLKDIIKEKKVLFITTKKIDYIRNSQELQILRECASHVELIYSSQKSYPKRLIEIYSKLFIANFLRIFGKGIISKCDVIFVGFAPQLIIPIFRGAFRNKEIVIDFFISVYDTMVCDRQKFKKGSIVSKLCYWIDRLTVKKVDCIITDTKAQAIFFIEEFGADRDKVETLYLEADRSIYYPRPQNKPSEIRDKFVVLYFGSILPLQGVDVVLDTIRLLKEEKDIFFDIIGPIPEKLNKPIQDNVRYTDWLPQEQLAERIAQADICLAGHFNGKIEKANRTIPGKAYIYEAMGKKMILGDSDANRELFIKDTRHSFVILGNSEKLSLSILNQYKNIEVNEYSA
ncbi:glycosyltransferase [Butyrivibrio sp. YAB3001]|uniref:glycosyltransferase n=1 Tax=Butyrivibrio sp. YAB3001 TaxID=1520812 RepID=UPI0008F652D3|nr:glycosyltransferase [Butyrivibrio sp. YAB3001]SFC23311.1 Glycosyltransferase involved in cell wall bisynthesis [Butyrivibrio sp. YAB3001]